MVICVISKGQQTVVSKIIRLKSGWETLDNLLGRMTSEGYLVNQGEVDSAEQAIRTIMSGAWDEEDEYLADMVSILCTLLNIPIGELCIKSGRLVKYHRELQEISEYTGLDD